jgi:hypothetical protein
METPSKLQMNNENNIYEKGTKHFKIIKSKLLSSKPGSYSFASGILCQNKIENDFVKEVINNTDYLFINYYKANIIGFAAVLYIDDDPQTPFLEIELICNSPGTKMNLRSDIEERKGAKDIINAVENLAFQKNCLFVNIKAIDAVIPYYYKLGYNFVNGDLNEFLKNRQEKLIQELSKYQAEKNEEKEEEIMREIVKRFYPNYLSETYQAKIAGEEKDERSRPARDEGIPMIKYISKQGGKIIKGKKTKTVPKRYIPKGLTKKDKKKQREMLKKSRKLYNQGKYFTRKKVTSFKNKESPHIKKAKKIFKVESIYPSKELAKKTLCNIQSLREIVKKGEGAYFSSGSRPNQSAQSWGIARLASSITGGKASAVDYNILENGCKNNSKALIMAKKARKIYGKGKKRTPQTKL